MSKTYLGVALHKKPREKGKHAKEIIVSDIINISYKSELGKSDYMSLLSDSFNKWLFDAFKSRKDKTKNQ